MKRSPSPWSTVLGRATTTSAVAFLLAGCGAQSDTAKSPPPKEKDVTSEGPAESLPPVAMAPSETPPAAADETPPPHISRAEFDDAAYRTAQISFDLGFHGVPMMYSWPSQGRLRAYDGDEETTGWSSPHLQGFLERVARESGAKRIHIIAHSMGNRVLTKALVALGREPDIQPMFENVIMAAPDVNACIFLDQLWLGIKRAAKRLTLYASSDDKALRASKNAKGRNDFQRLGESGQKIVVVSGLDTIDASGIDTSLLGHSYVNSCKPVLSDLGMLVGQGLAPLKRKLNDRQKEGLAYWAFPVRAP